MPSAAGSLAPPRNAVAIHMSSRLSTSTERLLNSGQLSRSICESIFPYFMAIEAVLLFFSLVALD
jgi:hypothetical protein